MSAAGTERVRVDAWALLLVGAVATAVVARLSFLPAPFRNDAGIYAYMGKVLATGGRLYQDFWDTKLPTVGVWTAPLYQLFGAHWAGWVIVQAALGVGAGFVLARAARRFVGPNAYLPTLLFMLVQFNQTRMTMTGFQLETVQGFFAACAAVCAMAALRERQRWAWPVLVGLLAAWGSMGKPTGLAVAGAFGVTALVAPGADLRTRLRWAVGVTLGAAVPVAAVALWLYRSAMAPDLPEVMRQIGLYSSGTPWRQIFAIKNELFVALILLPLGIRWVLDFRHPVSDRANRATLLFAFAWLVFEAVGVAVQRRTYAYHLLVLVPPAALLYGLMPLKARPVSVAASLLPTLALSMLIAGQGIVKPWFPFTPAICQYVVDHTQPGDSVWADQSAALFLLTDRAPGARLCHSFYFVNHDGAPAEFGDWVLSDWDLRKPKYILLNVKWPDVAEGTARGTPGLSDNPQRRDAYLAAWKRIGQYVNDNYEVETEIEGTLFYRRRS
jgi:hypothetical protein